MTKSPPNKGKGRGITFLRENINYVGPGCLTWPLSRNPNGYAMFGFEGGHYWAHRFMCELVNGAPPTPEHEAAHSCGRGKFGCVDPRHLEWKTPSGNALDARQHGTQRRNSHGNAGRLTPIEVEQIRALKGTKTQADLAAEFGVSQPTIRDVLSGRSHKPTRILHRFTAEEDNVIRLGDFHQAASQLGLGYNSVRARFNRLQRRPAR